MSISQFIVAMMIGFITGGVFYRWAFTEDVTSGKIFYIKDLAFKGVRVPEHDGKD